MAHIQRGYSTFQFLQSGRGTTNAGSVTITGVTQDFIAQTDTGIAGPDFNKTSSTVQLTFSDYVTDFRLSTAGTNNDEFITGFNIGKPTELTGSMVQTHRGVTSNVYGRDSEGEGDLIWKDIYTKTISFRINAVGRSGILLKDFYFNSVTNTAPVAKVTSYGDKKEIEIGQMHVLSASESKDAEDDKLNFRWRVLSQPADSNLPDNISSRMSFTFRPYALGEYVFELVVNDGREESEPQQISLNVIQPNRPPNATVNAHYTPQVNQPVHITTVSASDIDGDSLSYRWTLNAPEGSNASLDDASILNPTFTPDLPGNYTTTLVVNDGDLDSPPASAMWTVPPLPIKAPIAHAGNDVELVTGQSILLDASQATDLSGDLTYDWQVTARPEGSRLSMAYATSAQPQITPDVAGSYTIELTVSNGTETSAPVTVTYVAANPNNQPIAMVEKGGLVNVDCEVQLSSAGSSDPDGDEITFKWQLELPTGSKAQLSDQSAANPSFTPDVAGVYSAVLVVNDGQIDSEPATCTWVAEATSAQATRLQLTVNQADSVNDEYITLTNVSNASIDLSGYVVQVPTAQPHSSYEFEDGLTLAVGDSVRINVVSSDQSDVRSFGAESSILSDKNLCMVNVESAGNVIASFVADGRAS